MTVIQETAELPAPPERVWESIANPERWSEWQSIHSGFPDGTPELSPGAQFKQQVKIMGMPGEVAWTVETVEEDRVIAYAEATNDTIAPHAEGRFAPPVFAVVPAFPTLAPTMAEVIPGELLMMVVHGEQDFHFHRPIEPGMNLVTRATPIGL